MSPHCAGCDGDDSRRDFLRRVTAILVGVAGSLRIGPAQLAGLPIAFAPGRQAGAEEAAYPIPAEDGATIDKPREVILVRFEKAVYAFALSCPHQKTPLRWKPEANQFQCPKHKSRFQPDGSFIDGRATRNMDRYAIRREGEEVRVSLDKLYRADENREAWIAAVVTL
jgi:nitrite reductase/ring-hydroxylating ferredoxin subunit